MLEKYARTKMDENIQTIRKAALELREASGTMQAVDLNADGILASVKMLDTGVSDAIEIWE